MARVVEGRYAVLNEPARIGGLSEVLACSDLEDGGARVALKLLKDLPDRNETLQLLFEREVSALRELKHNNIVRLRDAGIDSDTGRYFLALRASARPRSASPSPARSELHTGAESSTET